MHLSSGGPKSHNLSIHQGSPISRELLVDNTKIVRRESDFRRLQIYEALIIQQKRPKINLQVTGSCRTLKLYNNQNTIGSKHQSRYTNRPNQNNPAYSSQESPITSPRSHPRVPHSSNLTANHPINLPSINTISAETAPQLAPHCNVASPQFLTQPPKSINHTNSVSPRTTSSQPLPPRITAPRRSARVRNSVKLYPFT